MVETIKNQLKRSFEDNENTPIQDTKKRKLSGEFEHENPIKEISETILNSTNYHSTFNNLPFLTKRAKPIQIHHQNLLLNLCNPTLFNNKHEFISELEICLKDYLKYEISYIADLIDVLIMEHFNLVYSNDLNPIIFNLLNEIGTGYHQLNIDTIDKLFWSLTVMKNYGKLLPNLEIFHSQLFNTLLAGSSFKIRPCLENQFAILLNNLTINDKNISGLFNQSFKHDACLNYLMNKFEDVSFSIRYNEILDENNGFSCENILIIKISKDISAERIEEISAYLDTLAIDFLVDVNLSNILRHDNLTASIAANFSDVIASVEYNDLHENFIDDSIKNNSIERKLNDFLENCVNLNRLKLSSSNFTKLTALQELKELSEIILDGSNHFEEFPFASFEGFSKLKYISLANCHSLKSFPSVKQLQVFSEINFSGCKSLIDIPEFHHMKGNGINSPKINVQGCLTELQKKFYIHRDSGFEGYEVPTYTEIKFNGFIKDILIAEDEILDEENEILDANQLNSIHAFNKQCKNVVMNEENTTMINFLIDNNRLDSKTINNVVKQCMDNVFEPLIIQVMEHCKSPVNFNQTNRIKENLALIIQLIETCDKNLDENDKISIKENIYSINKSLLEYEGNVIRELESQKFVPFDSSLILPHARNILNVWKNKAFLKTNHSKIEPSDSYFNSVRKLIFIELLLLSQRSMHYLIPSVSELKTLASFMNETNYNRAIAKLIFPIMKRMEFDNQIYPNLYQWDVLKIVTALDLLVNLQKGNLDNPDYWVMVETFSNSMEIWWENEDERNFNKPKLESFFKSEEGNQMIISLKDTVVQFPFIFKLIKELYPENKDYHPPFVSLQPNYKSEIPSFPNAQ
jgi:hypothetical protein